MTTTTNTKTTYKTISDKDINSFLSKARDFCQNGWKLYGPISKEKGKYRVVIVMEKEKYEAE